MNCQTCNAKIPTVLQRLNQVNSELHKLGLEYHDTLSYSLNVIDRVLVQHGFQSVQAVSIYSGQGGTFREEIGEGKWLSISWYRMESGRYEVVAYVN